jgi:hypothetical protein
METKTKYSLITLSAIIGFFIFNSFKPETSGGKYLTLKVVEQPGLMTNSFMVIVDESGKTEEVLFEKAKIDNITPNTIVVNKKINEIAAKGYEIIGVTNATNGGLMIGTYTFVKK